MKCPNCNNDNPEGSKFCIHCGNPLPQEEPMSAPVENSVSEEPVAPQEEPQTQNEAVVEPQEQYQEPVQEQPVQQAQYQEPVAQPVQEPVQQQAQYQEPIAQPVQEPVQQPQYQQASTQPQYSASPNAQSANQNGQRKSLISVLLLICAVIIVAILGISLLGGGPKKLYQNTVKTLLNDTLLNEQLEAKTGKANVTVQLSSKDKEYKSIDGLKADLDIQYDLKSEQSIVKVVANNADTNYLNATLFVDLANCAIYANEPSIYSDTLYMELDEDQVNEMKDELNFESIKDRDTSKERKAIATTLEKAINGNITKGKFSKKSVTIQVDGKDKKVTDNVLTFTPAQFRAFVLGAIETIEDDEEFENNINAIIGEDSDFKLDFDDVKQTIESIPEKDDESTEGITFEAHYYMAGSKFAGFEVKVARNIEDKDEEVAIDAKVMMTAEDTYTIYMTSNGKEQELYTFKVYKLSKDEFDIEADLTDMGIPVTARISSKTSSINTIDKFDTSKAVNAEELDEEAYNTIMENLEDSPLYSLFEGLAGKFDDYDIDFDDDDDTSSQAGFGEKYIENYGEDVRVDYEVPSSYEESSYSNNTFRIYKKEKDYDYANVYLSIRRGKASELIKDNLKDDYVEKETDKYTNIKASSPTVEKVNGRDVYKGTYEYQMTDYDYVFRTRYYVVQVSDDYCYEIEVKDDDNLTTEDEIKEFLNIKVK